MKTIIVLMVLWMLLLNRSSLCAQTGSVSAGGDVSGASGAVSFSIGQVSFLAITGSEGALIEGLQQPYEMAALPDKEGSISIYPNPVITEFITLEISTADVVGYAFDVFDLHGKILLSGKVESMFTPISLSAFPASVYLIKVLHHNHPVKSFKVVKKH